MNYCATRCLGLGSRPYKPHPRVYKYIHIQQWQPFFTRVTSFDSMRIDTRTMMMKWSLGGHCTFNFQFILWFQMSGKLSYASQICEPKMCVESRRNLAYQSTMQYSPLWGWVKMADVLQRTIFKSNFLKCSFWFNFHCNLYPGLIIFQHWFT